MWTAEQIREGMIPLPPEVRTRGEAAEFLGLPTKENDDVTRPYYLCAITCTRVDGFPFALIIRLPREAVAAKGWPIAMCPETRVMALQKKTGIPRGINSLY